MTLKIDGHGNVIDGNGNTASIVQWGSIKAAKESLLTLKNCRGCINCLNCKDCVDCHGCSRCVDCNNCKNCADCVNCICCVDCTYNNQRNPCNHIEPRKPQTKLTVLITPRLGGLVSQDVLVAGETTLHNVDDVVRKALDEQSIYGGSKVVKVMFKND